ncbi:MAG TPA: xanthine dehydrogenase family protein molybdopterin-binding subunit [Xanthobacteraceae bacterium]|nr:xanthine dehydrogenase family protein molybdopterin-binding subunit [Xanthobacteraceae bacterium]
MANAAAPTPKANMGAPAPRLDARLKVTGAARYPSDTPLGNPAFAVLVTSAIAKGRLERLDLDDARAVPGVLDILSHENTAELKEVKFGQGSSTSIQDLGPQIRQGGQILAVVVADSFEAANEAASRVQPRYSEQAPSATFGSQGLTQQDATQVSERHKHLPQAGDAEAALTGAAVTIDVEYETPTQHHNPMELFTTTCAWTGDQLTVYEPSQFVYGLKNALAERLGIDPGKVRVVSSYVGGAFGSKGTMTPRTALIALAARRLNRPVKLVATRAQGFTIATYRAETRHHIRLGADHNGKLVGYAHEGSEISSRPDPYVVAGVEDSAQLYAFGAVGTKVNVVHADRNTPGFMRSPPVVPYIYALESAMDEMAQKLGMDPIEFRRINDTMQSPIGNKPYSSRSLMACYDQAAEAFGWSQRKPQPGSMHDGDWLVGYGCATALYPTHTGPAAARVRLRPNGEARVQIAAHEIGNGAYTVIGQMAAERLGLELNSVTVEIGDSQLPPAPVAGGSQTTASSCSAVLKTCDLIRTRLIRAAVTANDGPLAGRGPDDLTLRDGRVVANDGTSESFADLFTRMGVGTIEEYGEFIPQGLKPEAIANLYAGKVQNVGGPHGDKLMYAMGAELVEVRVHALTREIRVPRMVGAFAAGRLMNTRTVHSQLMGGMIWGISSALHEATEIDPRYARYVNDNLADYMIPVNADVDRVEVILVSEVDHDVNPAGVKGLGELANVGTAAAVANAVYHATGIRVRKLPIRIEKLLQA